MKKSVQKSVDPGFITMLFLVFLGLLVMFGVFVIGPIMNLLQ